MRVRGGFMERKDFCDKKVKFFIIIIYCLGIGDLIKWFLNNLVKNESFLNNV